MTADDRRPREASRPATFGDVEPVAILLRDAIRHQQTLTSAFQLRAGINWQAYAAAKFALKDTHVRVIQAGKHIVALIELRLIPFAGRPWYRSLVRFALRPYVTPQYGVIQDVYVVPSHRRRGLASVLLKEAHSWFNVKNVTKVRAAIWSENHGSLRLFQGLGYEIDERVLRQPIQSTPSELS